MARYNLTNKEGITLKTQGKYVTEDISVGLSDTDKEVLVPENIPRGKTVLGVPGTLTVGPMGLQSMIDQTGTMDYLLYNFKGNDISFLSSLDTSGPTVCRCSSALS